MLIKASIEDVVKYGELVYSLTLDPAKSSYPTYADGIKTKADFLRAAQQSAAGEMSELLLFRVGTAVEGWISYFWIPEEKYLQLTSFSVCHGTQQALAELLDMLESRFPGYTAYFGYPADNRDAAVFLTGHGFQCIEQAWNHSFFFDGYTPEERSPRVETITRKNFQKFRAIYHPDAETYWNADRIFDALDRWMVFVYSPAASPTAALFLTGDNGHFEIYGTAFSREGFDKAALRELLAAALDECKCAGAKYLTYLCPDREKPVLARLGFLCVGQYVLYVKDLP